MGLLCCATTLCAAQQGTSPEQVQEPAKPSAAIQSLIDQSVLTSKGKKPFMLRVHFQVFDMKGVPSDEGDLTYWWGEAAGDAVQVSSRGLGELASLTPRAEQTPEVRRELYLLGGMLSMYIFPGASLQEVKGAADFKTVHLGQAELRCLNPTLGKTYLDPLAKVCVDVQDNIRDVFSSDRETLFNHPATFAGTRVALDVVQAMEGVESVAGHAAELHSIDPAKLTIPLKRVAGPPSEATPVSVPRRVIAGHKLSGNEIIYLSSLQQAHIGGEVILECTLSKEGRFVLVTPMASPNIILTQAAVQAIQTWRYAPWTLNGVPISVTANFAVHFMADPH